MLILVMLVFFSVIHYAGACQLRTLDSGRVEYWVGLTGMVFIVGLSVFEFWEHPWGIVATATLAIFAFLAAHFDWVPA